MVYWKDGNVKIPLGKSTEAKIVDEFDKIQVEGIFEVDVTYGSEEKVEIEAPEHIKNRIKMKVKSKTLYFELDKNRSLTAAGKIKVHLYTEKLNDFNVSGASSIRLNNTLNDDTFTLECSGAASFKGDIDVSKAGIEMDGAASVKLSGTADEANLELSGASHLKGFDFEVKGLKVDLSGASSTKVGCLNSLNGDVSGASSLNYEGNPTTNNVSVSGAASSERH